MCEIPSVLADTLRLSVELIGTDGRSAPLPLRGPEVVAHPASTGHVHAYELLLTQPVSRPLGTIHSLLLIVPTGAALRPAVADAVLVDWRTNPVAAEGAECGALFVPLAVEPERATAESHSHAPTV